MRPSSGEALRDRSSLVRTEIVQAGLAMHAAFAPIPTLSLPLKGREPAAKDGAGIGQRQLALSPNESPVI